MPRKRPSSTPEMLVTRSKKAATGNMQDRPPHLASNENVLEHIQRKEYLAEQRKKEEQKFYEEASMDMTFYEKRRYMEEQYPELFEGGIHPWMPEP
eukprot:11756780-Karenia_brevis.AAC.1